MAAAGGVFGLGTRNQEKASIVPHWTFSCCPSHLRPDGNVGDSLDRAHATAVDRRCVPAKRRTVNPPSPRSQRIQNRKTAPSIVYVYNISLKRT